MRRVLKPNRAMTKQSNNNKESTSPRTHSRHVSLCQGGNVHVYKATPKEAVDDKIKGKAAGAATRYFARAASEIAGRGKRYFMEQVYRQQ